MCTFEHSMRPQVGGWCLVISVVSVLGVLVNGAPRATGEGVMFSVCYKNKCLSVLLVYDVCRLLTYPVSSGGLLSQKKSEI